MHRHAVSLLILAACAPAGIPAPSPAPMPAALSPDALRRDLFIFASDSFRGRESGTPAEFRAVRFLAERLAGIEGVEPAGDSGFYQRVPLVRREFAAASRMTVIANGRATDIPLGESAVPLLSLGPGAPLPRLRADGELVFAGYGAFPDINRDDLRGLNLAGKVVVVVNGAPASADSARRTQLESQSAIGERLGQLLPRSPAAVVILLTGAVGEEFRQSVGELMSAVATGDDDRDAPDSLRRLPMIILGTAQRGSPLLPAGWPADDRPRVMAGHRFSANVTVEARDISSYNVAAIVRGTDPALNRTYVAFGAHHDHIGIQPPVDGDSIANGADDDASGSIAQLALARAFASGERPRRSLLFIWHGAEEKGLIGSSWFTEHPTVPIDSIVAQLNADMIGRNATDSLYIVGPGAAPNFQSRLLGQIVDSVNAAQPRPFAFNREWDSQEHPERIYYRSDHYNYANRGIPIVFLTSGLHDDYHKVSDEPEKIDFDKLSRVGRLLREIGLALGNRTTRPK